MAKGADDTGSLSTVLAALEVLLWADATNNLQPPLSPFDSRAVRQSVAFSQEKWAAEPRGPYSEAAPIVLARAIAPALGMEAVLAALPPEEMQQWLIQTGPPDGVQQ